MATKEKSPTDITYTAAEVQCHPAVPKIHNGLNKNPVVVNKQEKPKMSVRFAELADTPTTIIPSTKPSTQQESFNTSLHAQASVQNKVAYKTPQDRSHGALAPASSLARPNYEDILRSEQLILLSLLRADYY